MLQENSSNFSCRCEVSNRLFTRLVGDGKERPTESKELVERGFIIKRVASGEKTSGDVTQLLLVDMSNPHNVECFEVLNLEESQIR